MTVNLRELNCMREHTLTNREQIQKNIYQQKYCRLEEHTSQGMNLSLTQFTRIDGKLTSCTPNPTDVFMNDIPTLWVKASKKTKTSQFVNTIC